MTHVYESDKNWKYLRSLKPLSVCDWCYYTSNIGGVQIRNLRVAGRPRNKCRGKQNYRITYSEKGAKSLTYYRIILFTVDKDKVEL